MIDPAVRTQKIKNRLGNVSATLHKLAQRLKVGGFDRNDVMGIHPSSKPRMRGMLPECFTSRAIVDHFYAANWSR
jgi:hypothetical protein